jgi:diguanylate cyclase (GGDEF)-like protein/PAS domain S-box-containing protein
MREIVSHATDSVVFADAAGKTIWVNEQFIALTGYTLEDMVGRKPGSVLQGPDTDPATIAEIRAAIARRIPITCEILNYRKDGSPYWIKLTITPLFDQNDSLRGFISIERDVTAYRQLIDQVAAAAEQERQNSRSLRLIGQMSNWLFSAQSLDELVAIIAEAMAHIFPDVDGTLYLYSNSRDCLEYAGGWGGPKITDHQFRPDECWALRRGRSYAFGVYEISVRCAHVINSPGVYADIPIIAHGDTIGLLHLDFHHLPARGLSDAQKARFEQQLEIAQICVEQISLATAIVRLQTELREQSVKDALTGLWNRRWFLNMAESELRRATKSNRPISLVMLDLDHFKRFNDKYGHDAGDTALKVFSACLSEIDQQGVYAARFGGEEFALVCANMECEEASKLVDALREKVSSAPILHAGQRLPPLSFSAGVAKAEAGADLRTLIACADKALYAAKAAGRHQTEIFDETVMPAEGTRVLVSQRQRIAKA